MSVLTSCTLPGPEMSDRLIVIAELARRALLSHERRDSVMCDSIVLTALLAVQKPAVSRSQT